MQFLTSLFADGNFIYAWILVGSAMGIGLYKGSQKFRANPRMSNRQLLLKLDRAVAGHKAENAFEEDIPGLLEDMKAVKQHLDINTPTDEAIINHE